MDRLAGLTFLAGATGSPLLADAVAWLDCREESRIDSGDRLIKEVTEAEPDRLGKLNRQVPPDLEMIVHKAIDKDPARRDASAAALAEDLQRFIDDEPIRRGG